MAESVSQSTFVQNVGQVICLIGLVRILGSFTQLDYLCEMKLKWIELKMKWNGDINEMIDDVIWMKRSEIETKMKWN